MSKLYLFYERQFQKRFILVGLTIFLLNSSVFANTECADSGVILERLINVIGLDFIPYASHYTETGKIKEEKISFYLTEIEFYYKKLRVCNWPYSEKPSDMPKYNDILFETQLKTILDSLKAMQTLSIESNWFEIEIRNALYMSRELVKMFSAN